MPFIHEKDAEQTILQNEAECLTLMNGLTRGESASGLHILQNLEDAADRAYWISDGKFFTDRLNTQSLVHYGIKNRVRAITRFITQNPSNDGSYERIITNDLPFLRYCTNMIVDYPEPEEIELVKQNGISYYKNALLYHTKDGASMHKLLVEVFWFRKCTEVLLDGSPQREFTLKKMIEHSQHVDDMRV